jgi:polysaccharide biosynthesis/export protein
MKLIRAMRYAVCYAALLSPLPATAQQAYPPSLPGTEYRINVGDELDVLVWGDERMQRVVRVQPDGTFSFPLAGILVAAGIAPRDVSQEIQRRLADKYRNGPPDVTVTVRDPDGLRFFVVGKVRTPGSYAAGGSIDIVQALSMAGGLAEFANVKGAIILRRTSGGQVVERVKLARVLKGSRGLRPGALSDPLPVLRSGDVLVIP